MNKVTKNMVFLIQNTIIARLAEMWECDADVVFLAHRQRSVGD